jgi:hypothetical protein
MIFREEEIAPKWQHLGLQNLLHNCLNKLFKNMVVFCHYLARQLFWLLFKKLGKYFSNLLVTLAPSLDNKF